MRFLTNRFSSFGILALIRWQTARNGLKVMMRQGRLRLFTIVLILLLIWAALFWGFYRSFLFLETFLGLGEILVDRLIYLLAFALLVMLVFSNAIISFQLHYKTRETAYLLTLPLPAASVFRFLMLEAVFLSTWATLFLILPVAIAYGITHSLKYYAYLALPLFGLLLTGLAALLGTLLAALIPRLLTSRKLKLILIALALTTVAGFLFSPSPPFPGQETADQQFYLVDSLLKHTRVTLNPLLPSFWAAEGFSQLVKGRFNRSLGFLAVLSVNLLFLSQLVEIIAGDPYQRIWSLYWSRGAKKARLRRAEARRPAAPFLFFLSPSLRALLIKDLKLFLRDPAQWTQSAILFGLLAIYILNIKNMPKNVYEPFWKNLITFFNVGATALILATLTTRFVYPLLSLEGKTFWILGLAPLRRRTILWVKFGWSLIASLVVTLPLMLLSNHILEISGLLMFITCAAVSIMTLALVSLAMGLGAIFPDFRQDSPARIASGFGGTLNLILSIVYIVIIVGGLAALAHGHFVRRELSFQTLLTMGAGMLGISLLTIALPLLWGARALDKAEF